MAEPKGPLEGGPLGLPRDAYGTYSRMAFFAGGAVEYLDESWKRPKRHNKRLERAALWHTVQLDEDCGKALEPARSSLLLPPSTDAKTRYELQAGIRAVHSTLPFTVPERYALRRDIELGNTRFDDEDAVGERALTDRWHEWLWMDENGASQNSAEALGASAVLGEVCFRLAINLREILGWNATE
jgi:hypothetical protein